MASLPISPTNVCLLSGVAPSWGKVGLTTHVSGILARANGGTGASLTLAGGCIIVSGGVMAEVPLADGQVLLGVTGGPPIACTFLTGANMIVTPGAGSLFLNTNIAESDKIPASTTTGNLSNVVSSGFWYPVPHTVLANALPVDGSMIEFFYTFNYTAVVASQPTYSFGGAGGPITTIQIISSNSAATAGNGYLRVTMARTGLESAALQFELLYNDNVKILRTSENVGYNVGVGGWAADGISLSIGFSVLIPALPATFNLTGSRITYFV